MPRSSGYSVVHLELRTGDPARACAFYADLFAWRAETVHIGSGAYLTLGRRHRVEIGLVEVASRRPLWLPYVEVDEVNEVTERARRLGAAITLEPREGPAGWRSVISAPAGGEIGLWQPK
jgi:predicted enzyme related to lactoylglutathione lyase